MRNILINWVLPTLRQQGGVLPIEEIDIVEIELSADDGISFTAVPGGPFPSSVLSVGVNDLPFSDQYQVRGRVTDTNGAVGIWSVVPFSVSDNSPPGELVITVDVL